MVFISNNLVLFHSINKYMSQKFSEALTKDYAYWSRKPVAQFDDLNIKSGQIKTDEFITERYNERSSLPSNHTWNSVDIETCSDDELLEYVEFLNKYYRETYTIDFTTDYLRWKLHNGKFVSIKNGENIVCVLGYFPITVSIDTVHYDTVETAYLCTTPSYRKSNITQVMMDEVIRMCADSGYYTGLFCTNRIVPTPVATVKYYTRPFNYKQLRANDFITIDDVDDEVPHNKIKIKLKPPKYVREVENTAENVQIVYDLYCKYMESFNLYRVFTVEDIERIFFNEQYMTTLLYYANPESKHNTKNVDFDTPVDFLSYSKFDIVNQDRSPDNPEYDVTQDNYANKSNVIKATNLVMYTAMYHRSDHIITNGFKHMSFIKRDIAYVPDILHSSDVILTTIQDSGIDSDEDDAHIFDQNMFKSSKRSYINLFNFRHRPYSQNMVGYLMID